jgi:hypothetical protein
MNSKQFLESTTSGAIASVSTPVGKTQTRGKGVYPNEKSGNLLTGKKTNKKYANTVKESREQEMTEAKLDEEAGYSVVRGLVSEFNKLTNGNEFFPIDYKNPGTRVWTRGDGVRHRDPGYIFISRDMQQAEQRKWHDEKVLGKFWDFLSNKGARPIKDVAGEYSSSPYEKAVVYNKQLFVLSDHVIKWGSTSRLKNSDVWRQKKDVSEAKLDEEDVIIVPGQGKRLKPGLIPRDKDRTDHEVEMALSDLFQSAKNAKHLYELIKDVPETVGLEGWVQEKIIKAADYLNTVREYLEHKQIKEVNEASGKFAFKHPISGEVKKFSDRIKGQEWMKTTPPPKKDNAQTIKIKDAKKIINYVITNSGDAIGESPNTAPTVSDIIYNVSYEFWDRYSELEPLINQIMKKEYGSKSIDDYLQQSHADYWRDRTSEVDVAEGYRILPNIDRERYQEREGLEGPFRARNGKVYYYDPAAGLAYDPDTDFYIDYDTLTMMDKDEELTMENDVKENKKQSVDRIIKDTIMADQISKDREGNYIFRKGYFYRPSKMSPDDWAEKISKKLQEVGINNTVIDSDDIWKPFKGGAPLKSQSHYYVKIKVDNTELTSEGLEDDFSNFLQDLEKKTGIKGTIRKPGSPQKPKPVQPTQAPAKLDADKIENLKGQLKSLEQQFDPYYQYSDDYSVWDKHRMIAAQIRRIREILKSNDQVDEGIVGKVGGALALIAALWGVGEHEAKKAYSNSPQLQTLIQYHQQATEQGDRAKIQELERRIENHKSRLSLGKGEVMGSDDKPIIPTYEDFDVAEGMIGGERPKETKKENDRITAAYRKKNLPSKNKDEVKKESSIMKGIQNEDKKMKDKDPCWKGYEMIGHKKKDGKKVPNCVPKK